MATLTGTGSSRNPDTRAAVDAALRTALLGLERNRPSFGFVFASPDRNLAEVLEYVRQKAGTDDVIGCSTAGEITERGLTHGGLAVMLVWSEDFTAATAFSEGIKSNTDYAAGELSAGVTPARKIAQAKNQRHSTTILLTDGLSGAAEKLVHRLCEKRQPGLQVVGGAAGDEGRFQTTVVGGDERASTDAAAALHVYSKTPWGVGVNHGLRSTTKPMKVTRALDNRVFELDGRPAFEAYVKHAAERGIKLTRENGPTYMIENELGIQFFDKIARARAPLSVDEQGTLTCAAEVPAGSLVTILDGEPKSMIAAAKGAADEAKFHLGNRETAGVLLFDCVCRGMILKSEFHREIDAVRSVFGDVPVAGFLTYGEIARYSGKLDGWHNATAVVVAIPK
jgi:hypothetical protein